MVDWLIPSHLPEKDPLGFTYEEEKLSYRDTFMNLIRLLFGKEPK